MKYVLLMIALAAVCSAACVVEPGPTAEPTPSPTTEPTPSPTTEPTRVPTGAAGLRAMDSMSCVEVMLNFDAISLRRDDVGLSTNMEAANVELWIDFALLMSRLHGETVNFKVARDRVGECQ